MKKTKLPTRKNRLHMARFFLLLAVLINIFYIPCYFYVQGLTRSNALEYYQQKVEDGVRSLDVSLIALSNLQTMLNQDMVYRSMSYMHSEMDDAMLTQMRQIVRAYLLPYDIVAETGVSMGRDVLFTRNRIYYQREQLKVDNYFSCHGMDAGQFTSQFSGPFCVLPAATFNSVDYGQYDAFTIAWRWSRANNIYLFSTFPLDKVTALMAERGVLASGSISIQLGSTLVATRGTKIDKNYETVSATAKAIDLQVSVQIPNSYIDHELASMNRLMQGFLILVMLASALWVIACAMAAARPINRISDALYSSKHLAAGQEEKGTLADLTEGIKKMDSRLTNYEDIIQIQKENMRIHTLERALYRGLYHEESREAFHAAYPQFPSRWQMAFIQYAPDENNVNENGLTLVFTEYLQQELPRAILLPIDQDTLVLVLSAMEEESPAQELEKLRIQMQDQYGLLFSYLLSEVFGDPSALAGAYQQLEFESSTPFRTGDNTQRVKPPLSLQQLQIMYMALSYGDGKAALSLLEDCTAALKPDLDFTLCKYTYRLIANMLVTIKLETTCDMRDIPIPSFNGNEIETLYEQEFPRCFRRIAECISKSRSAMTQSLDRNIIEYIDKNLGNSLLCINMVTDHFQISAPTLQKRLHATVGQTFSVYVEDARMNKARQELRETSYTVQEISEHCGYAATNSFYKAYKRRFGEPPLSVRNDG